MLATVNRYLASNGNSQVVWVLNTGSWTGGIDQGAAASGRRREIDWMRRSLKTTGDVCARHDADRNGLPGGQRANESCREEENECERFFETHEIARRMLHQPGFAGLTEHSKTRVPSGGCW